MKLTDFKIKTRLAFGYSAIVFLLVILIVVGIFSISNINEKLDRIVSVNNAKIRHSIEIKSALDDLTISIATILLSKDHDIKETQRKRIENDRALYRKAMEELEKKETNDEGKNLIAKLKETIAAGKEANNKALELSMAGKNDMAMKLYEGVTRPTALKYSEAADAVIKYNDGRSNFRSEEAKKSGKIASVVFLSIGMATVLLCVLLGFFISNSITKPISKGVDFAKKMSEGDLSQQLNIFQKDEIGVLADALNHMGVTLRGFFKNISIGVETISSSSSKLTAVAQQVSAASEQTSQTSNVVAGAAEEMSSSMISVAAAMEQATRNVSTVATAAEEMTSTISEIARNSEKARTITEGAVVRAKAASMGVDELGQAAQEIGKVTETIAEISGQTNLLALNATIEAARAGEAGKGFAVVANEIKELAKQTALATEEIKRKIEGIQGSTGNTVKEIGEVSKVIHDVNEIVSTIAAAVEEQAVTTKEIASNVAQMSAGIGESNQNVGQSSSVAGEIAKEIVGVNQAASEMTESSHHVKDSALELSQLSEQLSHMINKFKV